MLKRFPLESPLAPRAAVVVLALLSLVLMAPSQGSRVLSASGEVEIGRGEPPVFSAAGAGEALAPGEVVRTGNDGRAELDIVRATVRLYPNSLLRIPESSGAMSSREPDAVELERGRSIFDVLRGADPFEVRTPEVVVSVKGTRFSVALDDSAAAVAVYRGLVGVRGLAAEAAFETLVREGFVAAGRDRFDLSLHGREDPWEAWRLETRLPELPEPAMHLPRQANAALRDARSVAMTTARRDAVVRAAERHPEVAEKLARLTHLKQGKPKPQGLPAKVEMDPVADPKREKLKRALEEGYVETYVNTGLPGGTQPPGGPLTQVEISFVDGSGGSGGDRLHIEANPGLMWDLDENLLEGVLDGSDGLPANLSALLANQGISEQEFAMQALMLFQ